LSNASSNPIDLPSASQMYRLANCPGSRSLIRSLRAKRVSWGNNLPGPEATIGSRIHAALEGLPEELNLSEEEIKQACEDLAFRALRSFRTQETTSTAYEERLTYQIEDVPFFTGKPDRVDYGWSEALDINYKTGHKESIESHLNLQLRTEVVLIHHVHGYERIGAAIIEPLVDREPEIVVYEEPEIKTAEEEILQIVDASEWDTHRNAGPWCDHCPARALCPEAKTLALTTPAIIDVKALPTGVAGAELLSRIETAEKVLEAVKSAYKALVSEKIGVIPGWHISAGKRVRFVKDAGAIAYAYGCRDFLQLPVKKLEEHMAKEWNLSGKAFREKFSLEFGAVIGHKQTAGSLERIPKNLLK
jgi:hypothetical protein